MPFPYWNAQIWIPTEKGLILISTQLLIFSNLVLLIIKLRSKDNFNLIVDLKLIINLNLIINYQVNRRGFEGVLLGVCSSVDVTQSEGDLPDFNQSEH